MDTVSSSTATSRGGEDHQRGRGTVPRLIDLRSEGQQSPRGLVDHLLLPTQLHFERSPAIRSRHNGIDLLPPMSLAPGIDRPAQGLGVHTEISHRHGLEMETRGAQIAQELV